MTTAHAQMLANRNKPNPAVNKDYVLMMESIDNRRVTAKLMAEINILATKCGIVNDHKTNFFLQKNLKNWLKYILFNNLWILLIS